MGARSDCRVVWVAIVASGCAASQLASQPDPSLAPYKPSSGPAATSMTVVDSDPPLWTHARLILPFGVTAIGSPHRDVEATTGIGTEMTFRGGEYVSVGLHSVAGVRNWGLVGHYYSHMGCSVADHGDDALSCLGKKSFGWAVAFGMFEFGWAARFEDTRSERSPWLSIGSGILAVTDSSGYGSDHKSYKLIAHAAQIGIGYDFPSVGIGLRTWLVPDNGGLSSTGAAFYSLMFTIEPHTWFDWNHPDTGTRGTAP